MILFSNAQSRSTREREILGAMTGFGFGFGVLALADRVAVAGDPCVVPLAEVFPMTIGTMLDGIKLEAGVR